MNTQSNHLSRGFWMGAGAGFLVGILAGIVFVIFTLFIVSRMIDYAG